MTAPVILTAQAQAQAPGAQAQANMQAAQAQAVAQQAQAQAFEVQIFDDCGGTLYSPGNREKLAPDEQRFLNDMFATYGEINLDDFCSEKMGAENLSKPSVLLPGKTKADEFEKLWKIAEKLYGCSLYRKQINGAERSDTKGSRIPYNFQGTRMNTLRLGKEDILDACKVKNHKPKEMEAINRRYHITDKSHRMAIEALTEIEEDLVNQANAAQPLQQFEAQNRLKEVREKRNELLRGIDTREELQEKGLDLNGTTIKSTVSKFEALNHLELSTIATPKEKEAALKEKAGNISKAVGKRETPRNERKNYDNPVKRLIPFGKSGESNYSEPELEAIQDMACSGIRARDEDILYGHHKSMAPEEFFIELQRLISDEKATQQAINTYIQGHMFQHPFGSLNAKTQVELQAKLAAKMHTLHGIVHSIKLPAGAVTAEDIADQYEAQFNAAFTKKPVPPFVPKQQQVAKAASLKRKAINQISRQV